MALASHFQVQTPNVPTFNSKKFRNAVVLVFAIDFVFVVDLKKKNTHSKILH